MAVKSIQHSSGMLSIAMLATAGLLASVSVVKVADVLTVASRANEAAAKKGISAAPTQEQIDKAVASDRTVAEALKKENLFSPAQPKRNPVQEVFGILGNEALINGQWYKVGAKIQDANVVAVEPTCVVIEWNGQRTTLYPIQAAVVADGGSSGGRGRGRGGPGGFNSGPGMTMIGGFGGRGGRGGFGNVSDADRQRMMEQFRNMQNMSPEQQQSMREQFRSMRGGGMGGGMDGGGMGGGMGGGRRGGGMGGRGGGGGGMGGGGGGGDGGGRRGG